MTLFNPAVHYLVLFALFIGLAVVTLVIGETAKFIRSGGPAAALAVRSAYPRASGEPGCAGSWIRGGGPPGSARCC